MMETKYQHFCTNLARNLRQISTTPPLRTPRPLLEMSEDLSGKSKFGHTGPFRENFCSSPHGRGSQWNWFRWAPKGPKRPWKDTNLPRKGPISLELRNNTVRTAKITDRIFIISAINQVINYRLWPSPEFILGSFWLLVTSVFVVYENENYWHSVCRVEMVLGIA